MDLKLDNNRTILKNPNETSFNLQKYIIYDATTNHSQVKTTCCADQGNEQQRSQGSLLYTISKFQTQMFNVQNAMMKHVKQTTQGSIALTRNNISINGFIKCVDAVR